MKSTVQSFVSIVVLVSGTRVYKKKQRKLRHCVWVSICALEYCVVDSASRIVAHQFNSSRQSQVGVTNEVKDLPFKSSRSLRLVNPGPTSLAKLT